MCQGMSGSLAGGSGGGVWAPHRLQMHRLCQLEAGAKCYTPTLMAGLRWRLVLGLGQLSALSVCRS